MNFVKGVFRFLWHLVDGVRKVLHLLLLLFIFGVLWFAVSPSIPIVPNNAALLVAPEGALVEQLSGDPIERAVSEAYGQGRPETLLRDVLEAIREAKTDDRIKTLVLDLTQMSGGGVAKLEEFGKAVKDFRESGKPVIAFGESFDQSQYYVASHADEIYLDPKGMVLIDGFAYYRMFMKDAIDKLAIDVNIFRAGQFKSYTEQYSRNDMSAQEREESLAWLNSLWGSYQAAVTEARGMPAAALQEYADQAVDRLVAAKGDTAAIALSSGLVTELKTRAQVEDRIVQITGEDEQDHSYRGVHHADYLNSIRSQRALTPDDRDRVGVIVASGEILDGIQPPGTIGGDSTAEQLRQARYDDRVKAVVLRIDSPGGSVFASEVIRREVDALKLAGKPVIASMSSTAASGGYYIAMDADQIWASPVTITGSIGVFSIFPTIDRTLAKLGVTTDGIGTTALSDAFRLDRKLGDGAKKLLQASVDHEYTSFVEKVANGRGKPVDEIDNVAQGRVWSGKDAQRLGLVDELGTFQNALDAAAKRANLDGDYHIEYVEPPMSWRQLLAQEMRVVTGRAIKAIAPEDSLTRSVRRVLSPFEAELSRLSRVLETRGIYSYCLCSME